MSRFDDPHWPRAGDWPARASEPVDVALLGLPTFRTSLSPTKADTTPAAIRAALRRYSTFFSSSGLAGSSGPPSAPGSSGAPAAPGPGADLNGLHWLDAGDVTEPDGPGEAAAIGAVAAQAAGARLLIALGGDNAATVPAALGAWGEQIGSAGLVTLDAHHDLRDGISNGSPVRRLLQAGLDGRRVVQIGIADFANSAFYRARAAEYGITVIHRDELYDRPITEVLAQALAVAGAAGGPVHVDLDVDVCDRSVAPACPASVPGGISAGELRAAARAAGRHRQVTSIDITEVDASADTPDQRTVRLAALCVLEAGAGLTAREV